MKNLALIFLATCFIFLTSLAYSQKNKNEAQYNVPNIPVSNESNLITYTKNIDLTGCKSDIYTKSLRWYSTYFKNPTEVIREKDETQGRILGKYRFKYNNPPDKKGIEAFAGIIQYTISVEAKDGGYLYKITDFNIKDISYCPIEYWLDKTSQKYSISCDYYLIQLDNNIQELMSDLEHFMKTGNHKK